MPLKADWITGESFTHTAANAVAAAVNINNINPKDTAYGAVGNGTTNDRAALAAADTAAVSASLTLMLPTGTYRVSSNLTISSPVQFSSGAILKPDAGITVILMGGVVSTGLYKIFDAVATGKVVVRRITAIYPQWWGAVGDDTINDEPAMNATLEAASTAMSALGVRMKVIIPATTAPYRCNGELRPKSNTVIENQGHLKLYGNHGHFCVVRAQQNVELYGGLWDSNSQGNDNTIAIGFVNANQTVAGPPCENIFVHHMVIKNSAHGGAHIPDINNPADVGRGGGKGITVQFGNKNILISDIMMDNCDLGFSMEGVEDIAGEPAGSESVVVQNIVIKNSKYMGLYLSSEPTTPALYGQTTSVTFNNIDIVDCGVGQTTEAVPRDVATLFGSITTNGMIGIKATNIRVRSTTGTKMTVFRGSQRHTDWDVQVFAAGEMLNLHNSAPYAGYGGTAFASRYNMFKAQLHLLGPAFNGYFVNSDATSPALYSRYEIDAIYYVGTTPTAIAHARYALNLPSTSVMDVTDYHTGYRTQISGASEVTRVESSRLLLGPNGLGFNAVATGLYFGTGSPEGVVTAGAGSVYYNTSGGVGISSYIKESGSGNTGWVTTSSQPKFKTGTVATAAATAAKTVTLDSPWSAQTPAAGDFFLIAFTLGNSANAATLSINGGTAFPIRNQNGLATAAANTFEALASLLLYFDGTYYRPIGAPNAVTTAITAAEIDAGSSGGSRVVQPSLIAAKFTSITTVPSTATSTGRVGMCAFDSSFFYICTATDTWRRVAIASW